MTGSTLHSSGRSLWCDCVGVNRPDGLMASDDTMAYSSSTFLTFYLRQMWEKHKHRNVVSILEIIAISTKLCFFFCFVFFSHGMLQYADSNAEHVMSSTKLMQSQQTPCSSPSPLHGSVRATGMKSHPVHFQVTSKTSRVAASHMRQCYKRNSLSWQESRGLGALKMT